MVGLCDCNNFYVSCERLFNPALEGRPVVVMSGNDGCVVARSNEAKALGIKMGQPLYQIRDLVARERVECISGNLQLYGDISERVMMTLRGALPDIEIYSIDEAFLDLSGFALSELGDLGRRVSRLVRRNVGVPVSIGISHTKTLAKVASKLCKSYPKLNGACLMERAEDITKVLKSYPIGDIWGVGRRSEAMLAGYNIRTAEQFRQTSSSWIEGQMGVVGLRTWRELHMDSCIDFELNSHSRESIMVSRSFSHLISDIESLSSSLVTFSTMAAEKLRRQNSVASLLEVFILTNRHRADMPQYAANRQHKFITATNSTLEIVQAATKLLREVYRAGYGYKKAGVVLREISDNNGIQSSMFDSIDRSKHSSLMRTMDMLNNEMGRMTITLGSSSSIASGKRVVATTNCENRSPMYTTEWSDILKIKV